MHIHIIGIAGTMTAPLAVFLKKRGNYITGSDQEKIYPPVSNILKKSEIPINSTDINTNIELAIIGSSYFSFKNTKQEFDQIKKLNIPYISATKYIAQNLIKENSILIAGSFGKTTITSLLSWIFVKAKKNPNYMFAGYSKNKFDSINISPSDWSIIEADESINGLDKKAKFLYYPLKHLILTSADWEHKDSYSTKIKNFNAFKQLIINIPTNGTLLINSQGYQTKELSLYTKSKIITYNSPDSDYYIEKIKINQNLTNLIINTPKGLIKIQTQLIGQFNFENILAAVALADHLNISIKTIQKAVFSFRGVKRRLEFIKENNGILFFDDFAQSNNRIKSSLEALKFHFPQKKIKVFFQPHASFIQFKQSLNGLKKSFNKADEIILGPLKFNQKLNKNNRITAKNFKKEIGQKLIYIPIEKEIVAHYIHHLSSNDILIYMSSGGLSGYKILKKIINHL
ncbi:MAG: Mur ligase family protein [Candidatus Shapirobacteria bacterium]|nr:Mur ligase family protein [Candidatus Shapirobacteria bacterium]